MKSLYALIAVGLDAARIAFSKSKIEKTAAAVVVGVVGIGLLASPFLLQANDEETNDAPEVFQLYVLNSGSIGFKVKFDVSFSSDSDELLFGFQLKQSGKGIVDSEYWTKRTSLYSDYCGWLSIPGFDGGPPLPYPGYSHSFDFIIEGVKAEGLAWYGAPRVDFVTSVASSVSVQLYVDVDSEGALESMSAWAVDSDGDSYEVSVYYSAGGGWDGSFHPFPTALDPPANE